MILGGRRINVRGQTLQTSNDGGREPDACAATSLKNQSPSIGGTIGPCYDPARPQLAGLPSDTTPPQGSPAFEKAGLLQTTELQPVIRDASPLGHFTNVMTQTERSASQERTR